VKRQTQNQQHTSNAPADHLARRAEDDASEERPLTVQEKRLFVARIVRADFLECFAEDGEFDLDRARRVLPKGSIQKITIHQTTRTDREGKPVVNRRITLHLVDKLRAIRADEILLKQEGAEESASEAEQEKLKSLSEAHERVNNLYHEWLGRQYKIKEALVEARQEILRLGGGWDPRRHPEAEEFLKNGGGTPLVPLPRDRELIWTTATISSEPARPPP